MTSQATNANLIFKVVLLSGNNVVLVDCPGFESELFMPQIINGRIHFPNIIPSHRCCDAAAANANTDKLILPANKLGGIRIVAGTNTPQTQRYNYDAQIGNISTPLAKSTPSNVKIIARPGPGKENVHASTPEQMRCKPTQNYVPPLEIPGTHLETSSSFHLETMKVPLLPDSDAVMNSPPSLTSSSSLRQSGIDSGLIDKAPPARTYARRKTDSTKQPRSPVSWSPKKRKMSKVSSTKALSPAMKLEVKHRKLIVDSKKTIPTNTLHKVPTKPDTKTRLLRMQVSGKTRAQFEALKETAFDHLTTPGQSHLSTALTNQFKDACLDKYSETLPNYAELSKAAPLQLDRQAKTLIAKAKRLEKQMSKSQQVKIKSKMINVKQLL